MYQGKLLAIYITPAAGQPLQLIEQAHAVLICGLPRPLVDQDRRKHEVFYDGQVSEEVELLEYHAHPAPDAAEVGAFCAYVLAEDRDPALRRTAACGLQVHHAECCVTQRQAIEIEVELPGGRSGGRSARCGGGYGGHVMDATDDLRQIRATPHS